MSTNSLLHFIRKTLGVRRGAQADSELLARFLATGDQSAFEDLVGRHGPLVWGVCRRLLGQEQAAEDVFQATFLVLARKARSVRASGSLAGWLYRVASRLALAARAARRVETLPADVTDPRQQEPSEEASQAEARRALDEEVSRLPERYRLPILLCFYQGRTHMEAAADLNWPAGTVSGRLARAKELLHAGLRRRGITLSVGAIGTVLAAETASGVPPALAAAAVRAAVAFASGVAAVEASQKAVAIASALLRAERRRRLLGVTLLVGSGLVSAAAAWATFSPGPESRLPIPDRVEKTAIGKEQATLTGHTAGVVSVSWSPDGKTLASASWDRTVRLWDAAIGKELATLVGGRYMGPVISVSWSPDGKTVAAVGERGGMERWDAATGKDLGGGPRGQYSWTSATLSPDGKTLVAVDLTGFMNLTGLVAVDLTEFMNLTGASVRGLEVWSVSWSPDGKTLATAGRDGTVKLWEAAKLAKMREEDCKEQATLKGPAGGVKSVSWSPDGKTLAAAGFDNTVKLLDAASGKELATLTWHTERVYPDPTGMGVGGPYVSWSPDGKTLASASEDGTVRLWDAASGKELATLTGHTGGVKSVSWSPDGKTLASASNDQTVRLWDVSPRK